MTYKDLKKFVNSVPDNFLEEPVIIYQEEQAGFNVESGFFQDDEYWNGDEIESLTPKNILDEMDEKDKEGIDILLHKKGKPYLTRDYNG